MRYGCYAANDHPDMSLAVAVQGEESANEQLEHLHLKSPSAPQKQALESKALQTFLYAQSHA